jgi:hypothetical protein
MSEVAQNDCGSGIPQRTENGYCEIRDQDMVFAIGDETELTEVQMIHDCAPRNSWRGSKSLQVSWKRD